MAPTQFTVHIGLPKTATTLLQQVLFAHHEGIAYMGKYPKRVLRRNGESYGSIDLLMRSIHRCARPDRKTSAHAAAVRDFVGRSQASGRVPLWSSEGICSGGIRNRELRAKSFAAFFGRYRTLIVLREPISFVKSMYLQKLKEAQYRRRRDRLIKRRFFEVEEWLAENWAERPTGALSNLDYAQTVDVFSRYSDDVGVFLFERLVSDKEAFIREICRFVGIDADRSIELISNQRRNPRLSQEQISKMRETYGNIFKRIFLNLVTRKYRREYFGMNQGKSQATPAEVVIPEEWRARIHEFAREGNRRLASQWRLPLAEYGYPI